MPFAGSVGYSKETPHKQNMLRGFLNGHLRHILAKILSSVQTKIVHYVIDATAGTGIVNGEKGSPLIIAEIIETIPNCDKNIEVHLIDKCQKSIYFLRHNLTTRNFPFKIHQGQYEKIIPKILKEICDKSEQDRTIPIITIYFDPNGSTEELPFDILDTSLRRFTLAPSLNILINISVTDSMKRPSLKSCMPINLRKELKVLSGFNIYIAGPERHTGHEWTQLFITYDPLYPNILGFVRTDTEEGQRRIDVCSSFVKDQDKKTPIIIKKTIPERQNISQKELAALLGIKQYTVSKTKKVLQRGDLEIISKVQKGTIPVERAYVMVRKKSYQREVDQTYLFETLSKIKELSA